MAIVGEDEVEALSALNNLIRKTQDKLLASRGFVVTDNSITRGDHFFSREEALRRIVEEVSAEKSEYYIRHVLPGMLADNTVPKGYFSSPFNEEKALTAANKLLPAPEASKPSRRKPRTGFRKLLLKALTLGKEFTSATLAHQLEASITRVAPELTDAKRRGYIVVDRVESSPSGRKFNVYKVVKEPNAEVADPIVPAPTESVKPNSRVSRFWKGSATVRLLNLVEDGREFTSMDAAKMLGLDSPANLSNTLARLIQHGYLRVAEHTGRGKNAQKILVATNKEFKVVPPTRKVAFSKAPS